MSERPNSSHDTRTSTAFEREGLEWSALSGQDALADEAHEHDVREGGLGANALLLAEMLSPEGADHFKRGIEQEISQNPALAHLKQIDGERARALSKFLDENGTIIRGEEDGYFAVSDAYEERMKFAKELWGEGVANRYSEIAQELECIEEGRLAVLGQKGRELLEHFIDNSPEPKAHAAHTFVHPENLDNARWRSEGRELTISFSKTQGIVDIPINYFVSAEGMDSWYGRGQDGKGRKISNMSGEDQTSLETIKEYSEAESTPPPVEDMIGFMLPDGRIYFKSGNAHRVAAAIRRGDENIQFTGGVTVFPVDYFPSGL